MRVRDCCKLTVDWLTEAGALESYQESGRFAASLGGKGAFALDRDQQLLTHYAVCDGVLYEYEKQWRRAYQTIHQFKAEGLAEGLARRGPSAWKLPSVFGPFDGVSPPEALSLLLSAFARSGFQLTDQNDTAGSAVFRNEDSCLVMDLPEPYGKWLQHRERRPRWEETLALAVEARVTLTGRALSPQPLGLRGYATLIDIELSALAPPLILELQSHLAQTTRLRALTAMQDKQGLSRSLREQSRAWLASI